MEQDVGLWIIVLLIRVIRFKCQQESGRKEGDVTAREGDRLRGLRLWEVGCRA